MFVSHIALDRRLKSIVLAKTTISGQFQGVESVFVNSLKMKRIQTAGLFYAWSPQHYLRAARFCAWPVISVVKYLNTRTQVFKFYLNTNVLYLAFVIFQILPRLTWYNSVNYFTLHYLWSIPIDTVYRKTYTHLGFKSYCKLSKRFQICIYDLLIILQSHVGLICAQ